MNGSFSAVRGVAVGAALVVVSALMAGATPRVQGQEVRVEVKTVRVEKLANAPGKTLTVVIINYAPGVKSGPHRHAGSVFAYALGRDSFGELRDRTGQSLPGRRELLRADRLRCRSDWSRRFSTAT
jgi:hypothetical protein